MERGSDDADHRREMSDAAGIFDLQAAAAKAAFEAFVDHRQFPCLGAKSVVHRQAYEFCFLPPLDSDTAGAALYERLLAYLDEFDGELPDKLWSFVACFSGPRSLSEVAFEKLLWQRLQELHALDARRFAWAEAVDSDPASPDFAFSVAGVPFFLVGMSPASSRLARRFPWPAIAFNFHAQFSQLREKGLWGTMQAAIRKRDVDLQGSINPELRDHGRGSQARQYSGCPHARGDWTPNFHPLDNDALDAPRWADNSRPSPGKRPPNAKDLN
ncbi:guanitoxin biosynthesis heme-dependent pre-guanitoxin N-hydroxylase GntA [Bradymonas sediminis]|uniref:YqcI/YcgG family protein n=1 Tax=Bradymonas sediminis TaxID=1548548 RepID=A0A2Z4FK37_9DELT|nr:guanitoxin biosynthesis heme-dependent pre-guanitoxin N-hydroxylase GntA [Bradymonas sediminis]AWV89215.1 YqcI/YcgG family protein [Bradymonas sediminis]TDP73383.1 hypothetical protein DFR33_10622 [Bradymonas sediminis]